MNEVLFQSLVTPVLVLGQMIVAFSWPAAIVFSGLIALAAGAMMALNHGTKAPPWVLLPVLLTHLQVFAYGEFGTRIWWLVVALTAVSIGWMTYRFRAALVAGLMFAWFALVYGGMTAIYVYTRINAPF